MHSRILSNANERLLFIGPFEAIDEMCQNPGLSVPKKNEFTQQRATTFARVAVYTRGAREKSILIVKQVAREPRLIRLERATVLAAP